MKENCQYPNIRFHYTDVRLIKFLENKSFYANLTENIIGLFYRLYNKNLPEYQSFLSILHKILINPNFEKDKKEFLKTMDSNNVDKVIKYLLEIYKHTKIDKQFSDENIKDKFIKSTLLKYLKLNLEHINFDFVSKNMEKIILSLPNDKFPEKKQSDEFGKLTLYMLNLSIPFMDIYLMTRMFRKFKKIEYQNSKEPENIIIYVGHEHAKNYLYILEILNFRNEFRSSAIGNNNCIDIAGLKQPLFK